MFLNKSGAQGLVQRLTVKPLKYNNKSSMASLKVDSLFEKYGHLIKEFGPPAVKKVGSVFHIEVLPAKGQPPITWTIDLKNGDGKIVKGKDGKADATFTLLDDDAVNLFDGKLQPQTAFMQGKLKIKGNMGAAMKLTPDLFPRSKL